MRSRPTTWTFHKPQQSGFHRRRPNLWDKCRHWSQIWNAVPKRTFSQATSIPAAVPARVIFLGKSHVSATTIKDASRGTLEPASENAEPLITFQGEWEAWYAWRPVRLYMTGRTAWLRWIYRRSIVKARLSCREYTDSPEEFPHKAIDSDQL